MLNPGLGSKVGALCAVEAGVEASMVSTCMTAKIGTKICYQLPLSECCTLCLCCAAKDVLACIVLQWVCTTLQVGIYSQQESK